MASLSNKSNRDKIINDNSDPAKGIILVIPRIFSNISRRRIRQVFTSLNLGVVERVDIIPIQGGKFKRAFIYFAPGRWNTRNPEAIKALDALRNGHQVKIIYDDPWYWKVSISRSKRPEEAPKPALSGASKNNNNNNNNAERKRRRKERANAAQKRLNKTRKQNAGRRKKHKTRRRRRMKKKC